MTRPSKLAFDSENLTPTEKACERELSKKRQSCRCCLHMRQHKRSGGRVCEEKQDVFAALNGTHCEYYEKKFISKR